MRLLELEDYMPAAHSLKADEEVTENEEVVTLADGDDRDEPSTGSSTAELWLRNDLEEVYASSRDFLKVASAQNFQSDGNANTRCSC